MKRSKINAEIKHMEEMIKAHGFELPPFCKWSARDWKSKGAEYNEIRDNMLGWDITDYGPGKFDEVSMCNDDEHDNRFYELVGRFPEIEEDEEPYRLLCNVYPDAE